MPRPAPFRPAYAILALVLALVPFLAPATAPPAVALAQEADTTFPLTVTDDAGRQTTFTAPPRRIVSLSPGYTETLFALGAGDRLVAVDSYSDFPAEAAAISTRLPTYPTISVETIVGLQPDLVVSLIESDDVLDQLRQSGIPVLKLFPRDFDATLASINTLGQVLGRSGRAAELTAEMAARRDAVLQAVEGAPRPRVFYEMDASDPAKPYAAGPAGFYGQIVDLAGGQNIFADLPGDYGQVSAESVIARDPEVIVLADAYSPFNPQSPALVAARPGWETIAAVRDSAVYAIQADLYSRPGPRLIEGLESLAYLLHPDRFETTLGPARAASTVSAPFCSAGQTPAFQFGFQALSGTLGATMGEPVECEHALVTTGDAYQQTTKGLAIYRKATNTPTFSSTTGRWALTADGLVELAR